MSTELGAGRRVLLRICTSCDRYRNEKPSEGEQIADAVEAILESEPNQSFEILRVACLNRCKAPCQALLTGREPLRFEHLINMDARFIYEAAILYGTGGGASDELHDHCSRRLLLKV